MYSNLTDKQIAILEFIKSEISKKGYPPAVREICDAVNLRSTSTVHSHLNKLEKLGYIRKDPTKPRAIEVLDKARDDDDVMGLHQEMINLPLIGQITAGEPIFAEQNIEEYIPLPASLVSGKDNFVLRVKGDSMVNAGILDGDYVVVDKKNTAANGQMVAALVENEKATVKTFYKEDGKIRLQPENDFMEPFIFEDAQVQIIGIVTGVFRVLK